MEILLLAVAVLFATSSRAAANSVVSAKKVFVTPEWVNSVMNNQQEESKNFVIAEVSWGGLDESPTYKKGHLPGAIHVDTSSIEDEPLWNLKSPEEVKQSLLDHGITRDTTVILYGQDIGAARVAFAYLWAGVENVKVLNGGLQAWKKAGYDTEQTIRHPRAVSEFRTTVPAHPEYVASLNEVREKLEKDENFRLVSIRSEEEFKGITSGYSYIPKAGEPKGAVWGKAGRDANSLEDYTNPDGTYIDFQQKQEMWRDLGLKAGQELSFYCGTGWRASIPWLIMYEAGYRNISIYDGGWMEWQLHDSLSVQLGAPASADFRVTTVEELDAGRAKK